jgi:hypothetical protein
MHLKNSCKPLVPNDLPFTTNVEIAVWPWLAGALISAGCGKYDIESQLQEYIAAVICPSTPLRQNFFAEFPVNNVNELIEAESLVVTRNPIAPNHRLCGSHCPF